MELGRDSDTGGQVLFGCKCFFFDAVDVVSFGIFCHIIYLFLYIRQFFHGFLCRHQNKLVILFL